MGEPHDRLPSPKKSSLNTFVALKEKEMSRYMTDITFLLTIMFYVKMSDYFFYKNQELSKSSRIRSKRNSQH